MVQEPAKTRLMNPKADKAHCIQQIQSDDTKYTCTTVGNKVENEEQFKSCELLALIVFLEIIVGEFYFTYYL